tara:strand:+ start:19192 stop:19872 length:681 start_codon:yes stop_codon:yes gene_type:complete
MNARSLLFALACSLSLSSASGAEEGGAPIIDLSGSALLDTKESRMVLEYVVQCALPATVTAKATYDGQEFRFPGAIGIAPNWRLRALTHEEQAAVSACMLARTNAFGIPVQISIRSDDGPLARISSFATSQSERRSFPVFEGAFFGNVFAQPPAAYACRGSTSAVAEHALRHMKRICTLPTDDMTPQGRPISACGFLVLGRCDAPDVERIKAEYANAAAEVYLPRK